MDLNLGRLGQIAFAVADVDAAEAFYVGLLGLRKRFRFGDLLFVDAGGVRLLIEKASDPTAVKPADPLYFAVADVALCRRELKGRGVEFIDEPHLIAPMEDHDLWMTFFKDPDGHVRALMQEAPKGYAPGK